VSAINGAEALVRKVLDGGWRVVQRDEPPEGATGGYFSVGYLVEGPDGKKGYLKALNFAKVLGYEGGPEALQAMIEAFNFERNLLQRCERQRMRRIVRALDSGQVHVEGATYPDVYYLIFEKAEMDARRFMLTMSAIDTAWALRTLHCMAIALNQLHGSGVAHQDMKLSNVFVFAMDRPKLGDLGRCAARDMPAPHDDFAIKGFPPNAPLELLYGAVPTDWEQRHLACDLYLLGSLASALFLGIAMTPAIQEVIEDSHRFDRWSGTYQQVLPHVRHAFGQVVHELGAHVHPALRAELMELVRYLCDPDPTFRGHPLDRAGAGSNYGLQRFVSRFDVLAKRAEYGLYT